MPVTVPLPDLAVSSVDKQFAALILGDLLSNPNSLTLGFSLGGDAACILAAHRPAVTMSNNVLISCHNFTSFLAFKARPRVRLWGSQSSD